MAYAKQTFDLDEGLAILTEMIVSEIGPASALVEGEARAAAVARVERLLQTLRLDEPSPQWESRAQDHEGDILFGRTDAEFAFAEDMRRG